MTILAAGILLGAWAAPSDQAVCSGSPTAPALDHVVLAVRDLDAAAEGFARHGFRLKPGRLHADGLLNRHVKFPDGSAIELMTVQGTPGGRTAAEYQALIDDGEGGVFAALSVQSLAGPERVAGRLGLQPVRSTSGPWRFLGFPSTTAAAVFFSAGIAPIQDPDSLVAHSPAVEALDEVWVEAGEPVARLLAGLGAANCGAVVGPGGEEGVRWGLARGSFVLVPGGPGARPRVTGAVLRTTSGSDAFVQVHPNFWVQYRWPTGCGGHQDDPRVTTVRPARHDARAACARMALQIMKGTSQEGAHPGAAIGDRFSAFVPGGTTHALHRLPAGRRPDARRRTQLECRRD